MKKFFRNILLFGVAIAMFSACGKEQGATKRENDTKTNTSLKLSKTELSFTQNVESKEVTITTSESWLAETPADWVTISPLAGNGTGSITISVTENMQNTARESYVKISTKSDEKMVVVIQSGDTNNGGENGGENGNENGGENGNENGGENGGENGDENGGENGNENGSDNQQGNVTIENGAIQAAFSVSNDRQVYFSQGNLQYQASTNTWRFAEKQFDIVGKDNENISETYAGWIDLFGWGTSGYNGDNPYMTSTDFVAYSNRCSNDIAGTNYDWGVYNKISNGGNQAGMWRTLTNAEWLYLISSRDQASYLIGLGRVNNVGGLILLPDGWKTPSSVRFKTDPGRYYGNYGYSSNVYSLDEWDIMQSHGAVFLPAAGYRDGTEVQSFDGRYWSSTTTNHGTGYVFCRCFTSGGDVRSDIYSRCYGYSVRLVRDL